MNTRTKMTSATVLGLALCTAAHADPPAADAPVSQPVITRQEYEQLLQTQKEMRQEIDRLKAERAAPATQPAAHAAAEPVAPGKEPATVEDLDDIEARLKKVAGEAHSGLPGIEGFVVGGDATVGFTLQNKANSQFSADFSPLLLFAPTDHLLFQAGLDVGIGTDDTNSSSTSVDLSIADASIIINDNLIVGGGLFVVPFGQYHNHFDPPWINKLSDDPIIFSDNSAPGSEVGLFAKGVYPVSCLNNILPTSKFTYDLYVANAPTLLPMIPTLPAS